MKKQKRMTDEEIVTVAQKIVGQSVGFNDERLTQERLNVHRYYSGEFPVPNNKGRSKFVAQDVFDAVESMKATLLETFSGGNDIGVFEPRTAEDVEHCRVASRYIDYVLFEQNDIFNVWSDQIHDGLTCRIGVLKAFWDKKFEEGEEDFDKVNEVQLAALLQQEGVEIVDLKEEVAPDGMSMLYSGTVNRKSDCSRVCIKTIAPETFFIEPRAENLYDASMGNRERMSRDQLLKRGIKQAVVDMIGDKDSRAWQTEEEVIQRHGEAGQSTFVFEKGPTDKTEKVWVYELFTEIDIDHSGSTKLWRLLYAGDVLLEKEVVKRRPYILFVPLRIPHKVHGDNYAYRIFPTQNANTVLMRGILDHTVITNNPRLTVLKGTVNDPRELIDNRYGGIINVNRPDGIRPVEQPPLNPFVFQTMQLLDYRNEGTSAVSKLSQGLNKDAVSKQNSAAMVEQITSMSMQRQKIIARRFANDVVKRLYELTYDIVKDNEKRAKVIPIAGQWVEVDPAMWSYGSRPFRVTLALGYGEKERQVQDWVGLNQSLASDPAMTSQYTSQERYNVWTRIFEAKGYKDIASYIKPPDQVQPPEPDPMEVKKLEIAHMEAQTKLIEAQIKQKKVEADAQIGMSKISQKMIKDEGDHAIKADAQDLKEREFEHKKQMDAEELKLAEKAAEVTAIASVQ